MSTETLLAISAGVTFLLAIAAFWAIWQNYLLHKKERKERLLNEIIDWAIDVAKCGSSVNIQPPQPIFTKLYEKTLSGLSFEDKKKILKGIMKDNERIWQSRHMELIFKYQTVDAKGEYILIISNYSI